MHPWDFLGGPVVLRLSLPMQRVHVRFPGQGTKTLYATGCGQKFLNELINYLN